MLNHMHLFHQNKSGPNASEEEFFIQSSDAFFMLLRLTALYHIGI